MTGFFFYLTEPAEPATQSTWSGVVHPKQARAQYQALREQVTVGPWKWPIYSGFTSLPNPTTARVQLLIYQRVRGSKFGHLICHGNLFSKIPFFSDTSPRKCRTCYEFRPCDPGLQSVENHWHGQVNGFPAPKLGEKLSQESNIFGSIFGTQPQICTEYLRFTKINRNKRFKSHMGYMGLNMDPVEQAARTWVFWLGCFFLAPAWL